MDDYALVLNAGSSSLKFCVFQREGGGGKWHMESRGQVEGIGTAPRLSVKNENGEQLADEEVEVRSGRDAVDAVAAWLQSKYGGARVLGVGHRVVHGGPTFNAPQKITPQVLDQLRQLIPMAPLHQPHNIEVIEAVTER